MTPKSSSLQSELIQIGRMPQYVPSAACRRCDVCCRFPEPDSFLRPYFTPEEIQQAVEHGVSPTHFADQAGSQVQAVPNPIGEGYMCPAFDLVTSQCRIYEVRPLDCQIYPLAVMWSADHSQVVLGWDTKCPFLRTGEGFQKQGNGGADTGEGRGAGGNGEEASLLEAYADKIAHLLEEGNIAETITKHPRLIGRFQDDVVVLRQLHRLTEYMRAKHVPPTINPLAACPSPLASSVSPFSPAPGAISPPHLEPAKTGSLPRGTRPFPGNLRPLTLADRARFERAMGAVETPLSTYAFAPHYIWRRHFTYCWNHMAGHLCLFAEYEDGIYMPLPPLGSGPLEEPFAGAFTLMRERNRGSAVSRIENVPEELAPALKAMGYHVAQKDPDYLYQVSDLVAFPGDRYKSQRAACNRFVRTQQARYMPYHETDQEACRALYRVWATQQQARGLDDLAQHMLQDAESAHHETLAACDALGLVGRIVRIDGVIRGYTFGYARSSTVFCVLLEVADRTVTGLAQFMFREFCREAADRGYRFINTMDDSGLPGLRVSKIAYRPFRFVPNYIASDLRSACSASSLLHPENGK